MKSRKTPAPRRAGNAEWADLGRRLVILNPGKFRVLLEALRQIVQSEEDGSGAMPRRLRRRYSV